MVQVLVAFDRPCGEAVAEQVALAVVAKVEALRVDAVQVVEAAREPWLRRLDDEVVVRAHQTEHVHLPAVTRGRPGEDGEERAAVMIVAEDERRRHAESSDVEEAVRQVAAKRPCHRVRT